MMLRQRSSAVRPSVAPIWRGRRREIGMAERHQFWARRRARRVQQQRDIVGLAQVRRRRRADRLTLDAKASGRCVLQRVQPEHADPEPLGDGDGRTGLVLGDEDRLGADIGEVEIELVGTIGRIERRGRGASRRPTGRPSPSPARSAARSQRGRRGRCRAGSTARPPLASGGAARHASAPRVRAQASPARHPRRRQAAL